MIFWKKKNLWKLLWENPCRDFWKKSIVRILRKFMSCFLGKIVVESLQELHKRTLKKTLKSSVLFFIHNIWSIFNLMQFVEYYAWKQPLEGFLKVPAILESMKDFLKEKLLKESLEEFLEQSLKVFMKESLKNFLWIFVVKTKETFGEFLKASE